MRPERFCFIQPCGIDLPHREIIKRQSSRNKVVALQRVRVAVSAGIRIFRDKCDTFEVFAARKGPSRMRTDFTVEAKRVEIGKFSHRTRAIG